MQIQNTQSPNNSDSPQRSIVNKFSSKKWYNIFLAFLSLLLIINIFIFSLTEEEENQKYRDDFKNNVVAYAIDLPDTVDFAGETLPLDYFDVREYFDREMMVNIYFQSQTLLYFKRANRFFPVIEPILKKNGIPDDFKYLAVAESGLANATSSAGARGYWQFMKETAKQFKLEVSDEVDERYHLEKSTEAACRYFKSSYNNLKNWTLVAASYNMGTVGVNRQINKQHINNYADLFLNEETARYAFRIVAIKTIMQNPDTYGYRFRKKDLYEPIPFNEITIDSSIADLTEFAFKYSTSYKLIKILNPWLREGKLTNKERKAYTIKIPYPQFRKFDMTKIIGINPIMDSVGVISSPVIQTKE